MSSSYHPLAPSSIGKSDNPKIFLPSISSGMAELPCMRKVEKVISFGHDSSRNADRSAYTTS